MCNVLIFKGLQVDKKRTRITEIKQRGGKRPNSGRKTKNKEKLKVFTVRLLEAEMAYLADIAHLEGTTSSEIVRGLIMPYIKKKRLHHNL
jgi:hypothetical protein